jgi:hypothetical protein
MPDFSQPAGGQDWEKAGGVASTSRGTTVTASGTTHTKGSWAQLIASTTLPAVGILVMFDDITAGRDYLTDIGVGAAGSEVVIAANLTASTGTGSVTYSHIYIPLAIPAGTRIAARTQCNVASGQIPTAVLIVSGTIGSPTSYSRCTTYGANTADSGGTSVDPGGTANTKGAWVQIVSSTTNPIRQLIIGIPNQINTVRTSQSWHVDIGIGGAGSELILIPDLQLNASTTNDSVTPQIIGPIPVEIPEGTRIAVRAQSDGIDATDRLFDVILYGID